MCWICTNAVLPHRLYFCTPHSPEMRVLHHMLYFLKVCWDNGTYKNWLSSFCNLLKISCTPCTDFNLCKAQNFFATLFPVAWLPREAFPRLVTVGVKSKEAIILWGWRVCVRETECVFVLLILWGHAPVYAVTLLIWHQQAPTKSIDQC